MDFTKLDGAENVFVKNDITYCTVDCTETSELTKQLNIYYTHLDAEVRRLIKLRQTFVRSLPEVTQMRLSYLCKLVTFHYNEYNEVLNVESLLALLKKIHSTSSKRAPGRP